MRTHDELAEQTTALEDEIADGPQTIDRAGLVLTVRWQMQQARELRRIREALERLARFAPDAVASGGDFDANVRAAAEAYAGDHVIQRG